MGRIKSLIIPYRALPGVMAPRVRGHRLALTGLALLVAGMLFPVSVASAAGMCPDEVLRSELRSGSLPDCRSYEMVTPVYKAGGFVGTARSGLPEISGDTPGEPRVIAESLGSFAGSEGDGGSSVQLKQYEFTRTSSGWHAEAISAPIRDFSTSEITAAGVGLKRTLWELREANSGEPEGWYMREPSGSFVFIEPGSLGKYSGASEDLEKVIFSNEGEGPERRLPGDTTLLGGPSLYETDSASGQSPILVGVDGSGQLLGQCGIELGSGSQEEGTKYNAISGDGNTIFFTVMAANKGASGNACNKANEGYGPPVNELYARVEHGKTVSISEPSTEDCSECRTNVALRAEARFQGASKDGSKAFFTTTQELLPDTKGNNLYEYDFDAPKGERIRLMYKLPSAGFEAGVLGVARASEDGSHIYFTANGILTTAPNGQGQSAAQGADNFYVAETDTETNEVKTHFVAMLCSEKDKSGSVTDQQCNSSDESMWADKAIEPPIDITPDGRFAVFTSATDLTPDDTSTVNQVFEYDSQTGALTRISIGQITPGDERFNDNGNTNLGAATNESLATIPIAEYKLWFQPAEAEAHLSLSDNGLYVFFMSPDGLTEHALNYRIVGEEPAKKEPIYAQNVYEYHNGNVYLLTDGRDTSFLNNQATVRLLGASASGEDVIFSTADQLISQDTDTQVDYYDARTDGGFSPPVISPGCEGEGCRGEVGLEPVLPLLGGSATAVSGDNLLPVVSTTVVKAKPKAKKKTKVKKKKKRKSRVGKRAAKGLSVRGRRM